MLESDWLKFPQFKKSENWGDPSRIRVELVEALSELRSLIATPIVITCGTQGVHVSNSYHYQGAAVDIVIPKMNAASALFHATKVRAFGGIGLYPDWQYQNNRCGGLHLDIRPGQRKYWIGNKTNGEMVYSPLTLEQLVDLIS